MSPFLTSDNHIILFIALIVAWLGPVHTLESLHKKTQHYSLSYFFLYNLIKLKSNDDRVTLSWSFAQILKTKVYWSLACSW